MAKESKKAQSIVAIELSADAWQRFERAINVVAKSPPQHRKSKAKRGESPKRKASKKRR